MNRLRAAREYLGFSLGESSDFLGVAVDDLANAEAGGSEDFTPAIWESLSRLYRRPIAWLRGDLMPPVEISPELHDLMEQKDLCHADRSEMVAFADWLSHRKDDPNP